MGFYNFVVIKLSFHVIVLWILIACEDLYWILMGWLESGLRIAEILMTFRISKFFFFSNFIFWTYFEENVKIFAKLITLSFKIARFDIAEWFLPSF